MEFSPVQQQTLLDLVRALIRRALGETAAMPPDVTGPDYSGPAGCFVTLHALYTHHLRGCIGQMQATHPLRDAITEMSRAVLDDPRFRDAPVTWDELPELELEITVLSPLEPAQHPMDFDLLDHGIYLRCADETGVFLPQVARETGWTREQLLARLCSEKMGLPENAWKHPEARLFRFSATIIGPEPFVPWSAIS
jgi:AmmeMemoRadiSam system protein A